LFFPPVVGDRLQCARLPLVLRYRQAHRPVPLMTDETFIHDTTLRERLDQITVESMRGAEMTILRLRAELYNVAREQREHCARTVEDYANALEASGSNACAELREAAAIIRQGGKLQSEGGAPPPGRQAT